LLCAGSVREKSTRWLNRGLTKGLGSGNNWNKMDGRTEKIIPQTTTPKFVAQTCPVCNGFGTLKYGTKICQACKGRGYIVINNETGLPVEEEDGRMDKTSSKDKR